jgi:hypothetical protein
VLRWPLWWWGEEAGPVSGGAAAAASRRRRRRGRRRAAAAGRGRRRRRSLGQPGGKGTSFLFSRVFYNIKKKKALRLPKLEPALRAETGLCIELSIKPFVLPDEIHNCFCMPVDNHVLAGQWVLQQLQEDLVSDQGRVFYRHNHC